MQAFVHEKGALTVKDMNKPVAGDGQVVVALKTAGLNRRDTSIPKKRGDEADPLILGSDGAGMVEQVGPGVSQFAAGDEVIINPSLNWYNNSEAPPEPFDILGLPDHGTFAEFIAISAEQLELKPEYLTWEEAGVVALPAMTGYRAMFTKGNLKPDETVFIPGAGSGVATYLIQFAKTVGARVIVSSRSEDKRKQAETIGADLAIDTNSDWQETLKNETIDVVIDSVGAATLNRSLGVLKRGGKLVVFGATAGDVVELNVRDFFYGQYQMIGSTMASRVELRDMLTFIDKHDIHPIMDKSYPLDEANIAMTYLSDTKQFGNVGLTIRS